MASNESDAERYRVDEERGVIEILGTREDRVVDLDGNETDSLASTCSVRRYGPTAVVRLVFGRGRSPRCSRN